MSPRDPAIAFGLRAMSMAFKAKAHRLKMLEAAQLASLHQDWIPDDMDAALAVIVFLSDLHMTPVKAGQGLLTFLTSWSGADMAETLRSVETRLAEQTGVPEFDWQTRADICG
ncbi:hypothetical protein EMVG_00055 [Emiliania huxleyi virus PS401]|nr:hypothetical protein EMVG_00055 [Emiliania huxleyi virus PS401]